YICPRDIRETKSSSIILDKISEETKVEEFIINRNPRTIPILTRNSIPTAVSAGPNMQRINEPSLKKSSQKQDDARELKAQGLVYFEANNYE
ncbi:18333_t:CDS:1, partial [Racocetra fulgida]